MDEIEKNVLISQNIKKYKSIFKKIEKDKKPFAEKLYRQAAFMEVTLDELKQQVNTEGAVIKFTNGNGFEVTQEHPAQVSYNKMIKNYSATIKALVDMLPPDNTEGDELIDFLKGGNK